MQTASGSLVITNAHAKSPQVFWNGQKVDGIKAIKVNNDGLLAKVTLIVAGDPVLAEMAAAGIEIRVGA